MATKQLWTLDPEVYPDLTRENSAADILCPTIRVALVTDRQTPVFKHLEAQFLVTDHPNSDHDAFLNWLRIENHTRKGNPAKGIKPLPPLGLDEEAAELFLAKHPIYATKRGLRHQLKHAA